MGAGNQPQNKSQTSKGNNGKNKQKTTVYEDEYKKSYETLKSLPNFFNSFLSQSPRFSQNLGKLFPKALDSFEAFFEMVMYLRKYDASIKLNKQAESNIKGSTLLDRFFMICLGNVPFAQFLHMKISKEEIQNLIIEYFHLFIQKPKKGALNKIVKFIQMQQQFKNNESISVKQFSQKFRQYLPHAQKFLKDYYFAKFHQAKKNYLLLKQLNSKIIQQDAIILALRFCDVAKTQITQLYNSDDFGIGLHTIQRKIIGYTGPWLLLIEHSQKTLQGQRQTYIFGTYQNGPVKDVHTYQGDVTSFMFSIEPNIRFMTTDKGQGGHNYFLINNLDEKVTKRRKGIGFGGTNQKQNFKLWIDADMDKSKVFNGNDPTYGYGALAGPGTDQLYIKKMEIWGLGSQENLKEQQLYWEQRMQEIMKRRKVNKKEFFDQNPGLFFQNTFAHRQQVIGQIENPHQKQVKSKRQE